MDGVFISFVYLSFDVHSFTYLPHFCQRKGVYNLQMSFFVANSYFQSNMGVSILGYSVVA